MKGNFKKLINGDKPVLIDFYAEWCGPCKAQAPVMKNVAKELNDKVRVIKIDVDKNQTLAQRYKINSVPTLALFKKGQMVWQESGAKTKQQLITIINHLI